MEGERELLFDTATVLDGYLRFIAKKVSEPEELFRLSVPSEERLFSISGGRLVVKHLDIVEDLLLPALITGPKRKIVSRSSRGGKLDLDQRRYIDLSRLKVCARAKCERLFVARRIGAKACSPRCGSAVRQTRYREEHYREHLKEKHERQRAAQERVLKMAIRRLS